jgi:hypothetical protein
LQDSKVYEETAHKLLNQSSANRNKLTVDVNGISDSLLKQYPELQDAAVTVPLIGDKPTIIVRPAMAALVLAAKDGTFIIDSNGRALADVNAGTDTGQLKVPTVTDQSDSDVKLGQQVLPRSATRFITLIARQFDSQQIPIQSMTLPAAASELDVYVANQPYYVKFNLRQAGKDDAAAQVGTYIATIKKLDREGAKPAEYVDVRLEGRAYYK